MNTTHTTDINIVDLRQEDLHDVASLVAKRQKTPDFMRFLKEQPMTAQQNLEIFKNEYDSPHTMFKGIHVEWIQDMVWFLLFHCFNASRNELELGFRIDPLLQKKWICTQAVKISIQEVFSQGFVDGIIGRHSAWNKGSFGVFRKSWFRIADFVPEQTFLPNIGKVTDDFKRHIPRGFLNNNEADDTNIPIHKDKIHQIHAWLQKHDIHQI